MILLLLALLSTNIAFQGTSFNLTLSEQTEVVLDDCMFFEHSLKSVENLSAGNYVVIVGYGCEGLKTIILKSVSGEERAVIEIRKAENFNKEVTELQKEMIKFRRENEALRSRIEYLQSLVEIVNSINVDLYDKIKAYGEENLRLKSELENARAELANYSKNLSKTTATLIELQKTVEELKAENSKLSSELKDLEAHIKSVAFYTDVFKFSTILLLAILVGIFLAFLRRY
ncbi:MAG: hypothetical protein QW672_05190 [Archaeoglobaceae archaeon]